MKPLIDIATTRYGALTLYGTMVSAIYSGAQSPESRSVEKSALNALIHFHSPVSRIIKDPAERFHSLKARWQEETKFLSDTNEICTHQAYQKIIGMGEKALPFILLELKTDPDHWFWALKAITSEDPVPKSERGNLEEMTRVWVEWLENNLAEKGPQSVSWEAMYFGGGESLNLLDPGVTQHALNYPRYSTNG